MEKWLRCNPSKAVTQYEVVQLIKEGHNRAASIANAVNGFKVSGLGP